MDWWDNEISEIATVTKVGGVRHQVPYQQSADDSTEQAGSQASPEPVLLRWLLIPVPRRRWLVPVPRWWRRVAAVVLWVPVPRRRRRVSCSCRWWRVPCRRRSWVTCRRDDWRVSRRWRSCVYVLAGGAGPCMGWVGSDGRRRRRMLWALDYVTELVWEMQLSLRLPRRLPYLNKRQLIVSLITIISHAQIPPVVIPISVACLREIYYDMIPKRTW